MSRWPEDHPTGCTECEILDAYVEGMTMMCPELTCHDVYCIGHKTFHFERKHGEGSSDE